MHEPAYARHVAAAAMPRRMLLAAALGASLRAAPLNAAPRPDAMALSFRGTGYLHRWSRDGQHEFTPEGSADLTTWRDMITLNVHAQASTGEQLADVANRVLGNYRAHGKVLQTRSTPRTPGRPAEHLIVAVLGNAVLLEAAFARCLLHDGVGIVAVVSHRIYGKAVGPEMSEWLRANGPQVEQALMSWSPLPGVATLQRLPRRG